MGQLDWEYTLDEVVETAQISSHHKGGLREAATLTEVIDRLTEKWEEALRYSEYGDFVLELVDGNGTPIPGRTQMVVCKGQEHAEVIAENLLGDINNPDTYWRFKEEWVR